jgi:hypothetical protein
LGLDGLIERFWGTNLGLWFAYQPKTVETPKREWIVQYGCLNVHAKRDDGPKLSLTIKNKWLAGLTKSWFYYHVPCRRSSKGSKSICALQSCMSELNYDVWPEVECLDNDPNDVAFVRATTTIGGRDAIEEYVACKMYMLAVSFGFKSVPLGMTPMSKVETTLLLFTMGTIAAEHADHVLVEVETEAKRVLGSLGPREYDALVATNILNISYLNRVLEEMGVLYTPCPIPGSEASQAANKNRKAEVSKKPTAKKAKAGLGKTPPSKMAPPLSKSRPVKKVGALKIARSKAKLELRGTSKIELALVKPIGVSKMFHLLDVAASSHAPRIMGANFQQCR